MSTGTTGGRDRYRFEADEVDAVDATLREVAKTAETADECAREAAEQLDETDHVRIRIRAYQIGLYEPDWPPHVTRDDVEGAAAACDTLRDVVDELRVSRRKAKRALRWAGVADDVERTTMLSVLQKVRNGDLQEGGD